MGNRFGLKDVLTLGSLALILVSIWLAMFQIDRQWLFIKETQGKLDAQLRDIAEIRRQLNSGAVVAPGAIGEAQAADSWRGFARARAATERADYAEGDWLVDYVPSNLETLSPGLSSDAYSSQVQGRVLDSLLTRDPETLEWLPLVAESWTVSDDGLVFDVKIRRGVTFSDGQPLTANDVAFSFRFIMDERIASPRARAYYSRIQSMTAEGDHVIIRLTEPYFEALELVAGFSVLPEHFYGRYLESVAAAEEYNRSTGLLLGSGPYRMENPSSWRPGDPLEVVRNERYWGAVPPAFDRIVWKVIQNDAALLTEFKNGDLDVYHARPLEYRELLKEPDVLDRSNHYEFFDAQGGYLYIAWNQQRNGQATRFADPRVREAMTYLTDRARIVNEVFLGYAQVANGPFNPLGGQHNPELPVRQFDPARARALLKDAGYEDRDGDGVLESASGEPFRFTLTYPSGGDDWKRMMLLLKDLYVQVGILMEPTPTDWPLMLKALNDKDFDAISLGWTSGFEIDLYQFFHSDQTIQGGDNFMNYVSPELDTLIERARREMDEDARVGLWRRCHEILWRDQPYTFLIRRSRLDFLAKRIENVQRVRAGINAAGMWGMPGEWYVPGPAQVYRD